MQSKQKFYDQVPCNWCALFFYCFCLLTGCLIDWLAFNHSFDKDNIDI